MTRKELDRYFKDSMYDSIRADLNAVMDAHPEITNRQTIELAADKIDECRGDGVELSVDNAVRLVINKTVPSAKELAKSLVEGGFTQADIPDLAESLLNMEIPGPTGEKPKESAQLKANALRQYAEMLTEQNKDIVLLGVPDVDPGWDYAQLKIAFFSENLTDEQRRILTNMKVFADEVKYIEEDGIATVIFYINELK